MTKKDKKIHEDESDNAKSIAFLKEFERTKGKQVTEDVIEIQKGGGTIINSDPIFSKDNRYLFANAGSSIKVFNTETGELIRTLRDNELPEKESRIVSLLDLKQGVASVTFAGHVSVWNCSSGLLLHRFKLNNPHNWHFQFVEVIPDFMDVNVDRICAVAIHKLMFFTCKGEQLLEHPLNDARLTVTAKKHGVSFGGPTENKILAAVCSKEILVYFLNRKKSVKTFYVGDHRHWTCVACHPTEPNVAAGDSIGRVVIFSNVFAKSPVETVYHWHTLPCQVVSFTPAGSTMYSGGGEHVLVKWNIENPNVRHFLPRLSGDIVLIRVSQNGQLVAVGTSDNGIQVVDAQNRLKCTIQEMSWGIIPSKHSQLFAAGLTYDRRSRCLVLNGRPGHLQFYSPESKSSFFHLDVTQRNYLTQERDREVFNVEVTNTAVSCDSAWLATVETRNDPKYTLEIRLKFWNFKPDKQSFTLNTSIENPHYGLITCLKFRPGSSILSSNNEMNLNYLLVTSGGDKKFRTWCPAEIDSVYRRGVHWACESVGFYHKEEAGPVSFSDDGSLLAAAFGATITIWNLDEMTIKSTLTRSNESIKFVEFGRFEKCHLLVCGTLDVISVWNLLTLSLVWTVPVRPKFLLIDPFSSYMGLITVKNSLIVFDPESGKVVHFKKLCAEKTSKILAATFTPRDVQDLTVPRWMRNSILYYLNSHQELFALDVYSPDSIFNQNQVILEGPAEETTLFKALNAQRVVTETTSSETGLVKRKQYGVLGAKAITELLRAPAHTMPPIRLLCGSMLKSLAISNKPSTPNQLLQNNTEDEGIVSISQDDSSADEDDIQPMDIEPLHPEAKQIELHPGEFDYLDNLLGFSEQAILHPKKLVSLAKNDQRQEVLGDDDDFEIPDDVQVFVDD